MKPEGADITEILFRRRVLRAMPAYPRITRLGDDDILESYDSLNHDFCLRLVECIM
tara:strand:- start:90 stop:257 length:168 start_codon:yes stop_codon:yes gene_type:complete